VRILNHRTKFNEECLHNYNMNLPDVALKTDAGLCIKFDTRMLKKNLLLSVIVFVSALPLLPARAFCSEHIRVAISDNQRSVTLASPSGLVVEGRTGPPAGRTMTIGTASVGSRPLRVRAVGDFVRVNKRTYRGWIELRKKKNGLLLAVNELDIELYLLGVVASEIPHDWHRETLKAQAVASRTYALYQKRLMEGKPYHVLATEDSQMYTGRSGERTTTSQAVRETAGQVIVYNGELIPAFYHSSCGGHTEDASKLWEVREPYLQGVDCDCQDISKYGQWERRFSLDTIAHALRRRGYPIRQMTSATLGAITPAGRVKDVAISHTGGSTVVPAEALRAAVGNARLPSVFFELELSPTGKELIFSGRGMGHGVGLCQWGAEEMARRQFGYQAILGHYYPGTRIVAVETM
jgi:stage II sporulation protein D